MRARGVRRRQELLDACLRIISTRGIAGVTHRAVAAEAGVPSSSTTYFFATLDDLIAESVRSAMDAELARIRELGSSIVHTDTSVNAVVDGFVEFVRSAPAPHTVAQFETYLHGSRAEELRGKVAAIISATREVAAETARGLGITDPSAGQAIVAMIDGFALHRLAAPGPGDYDALRVALTALSIGYGAIEQTRHLTPPSDTR